MRAAPLMIRALRIFRMRTSGRTLQRAIPASPPGFAMSAGGSGDGLGGGSRLEVSGPPGSGFALPTLASESDEGSGCVP